MCPLGLGEEPHLVDRTLDAVKVTSVGPGGGGAATIANGADVAQGSTTDTPASVVAAETVAPSTGISLWKAIKNLLLLINSKLVSGTDIGDVTINNAAGNPVVVSGTVTAAAQPGVDIGDVTINNPTATPVQTAGWVSVVTVTPTLTAATIYHVDDAVGGKQTIASAVPATAGSAVLQAITVRDKSNQKAPLSIILFNADPSAATITNHAAFVYSTDISKQITVIDVATNDYTTINGIATAKLRNLAIPVTAVGSASLFAAVVTLVSPGTYAAVSDLDFTYRFMGV